MSVSTAKDPSVAPPRWSSRLLVTAVALVGSALLAWRLAAGASYRDDGYAVAVALRLARGDRPLADEQSLQSLGALPGVPVVWLWDHLVGTDGLVLVARVLYVLVAVAVGALAYRGLRTTFTRAASLAGVGAALFAIPYQVATISYASTPVLAVLVCTAAGLAMLRTRSTTWAVALGVSGAVGGALAPQLAPAFVLMVACWLLLAGSRRLALVGVGAAAAVAVAAAVPLLVIVGPDGIRSGIDYTLSTRSDMTPLERIVRAAGTYRMFVQNGYLPVMVCVAATAVASLRASWRPARVAASGLACLLAAALSGASVLVGQPTIWFGTTASALTAVVVVVLAVAVAGELVHSRRRSDVAMAVGAVATGVIAALNTAAMTASGPQYSVHGSLLAGTLMVLTCFWVRMASAVALPAGRLAAAIPMVCIASAWWVQPSGDAPTWQLDTRIQSGPWHGVMTTADRAADLAWLQTVVQQRAQPKAGILFIGFPGGYLFGDQRPDTNALWTDDGAHDQGAIFRWMDSTGRRPNLVITAAPGTAPQAPDALSRWVSENYSAVEADSHGTVWMKRSAPE